MFLAPLFAAALLQTQGFAEDAETLGGYMAHACTLQQADNQGGEAADYEAFCACLSDDMAANSSPELFRALALGSQGALGERSMLEDGEGARAESERVFGTLEPEEQLSSAGVIQNGLLACLPLAPVQTTSEAESTQ